MRLVALIALLLPIAAYADPVTIATYVAYAFVYSESAWVAAAAWTFIIGSALYGNSEARKKAAEAADNAKAAFNNSLKDRTVTRIGTDSAPRIIYGEAIVGSDIMAILVSGSRDEYKHLVCVHAGHECESIDEIYINDVAIGTLDADGWATTGPYVSSVTETFREPMRWNSPQTLTHTPIAGTLTVTSKGPVYKMVNGKSKAIKNYPYTYTLAGTTLTLGADYNNDGTHDYFIKYQYAIYTSRVKIRKHLGSSGQTVDADLHALSPTGWPDTSRLFGYCYTVVTLNLNQPEFQGGPPSVKAKIKGKKLYDLRTKSSAYSTNPALAIYDYLTSEICGVDPVAVSNSGTAQAAASTSLTLAATASATDDFYTGMGVRITSGAGTAQERTVLTSRKNWFTYSNKLDNAVWSKALVTVTPDAALGVNGELAADLVVPTAISGLHVVTGVALAFPASTTACFTRRAKLSGVYLPLILAIFGKDGAYKSYASFNLSTGTMTNNLGTGAIITNLGNGWYECSVTGDVGAGAGNTTGQAFLGAFGNYTGNGVDGFYFDDAQFEAGAIPTTMVRTEASAAVGIEVDVPWSSNQFTYSEQFDNAAWTKTNSTIKPNAIVAPDGSMTADKVVSAAVTGRIAIRQVVTVVANQKYAAEFSLKSGEYATVALFFDSASCAEGAYYGSSAVLDLNTGASSAPSIVTLTDELNGWWRARIVATPTTTASYFEVAVSNAGNVNTAVGDGVSGFYITKGQHSIGTVQCPYSPTTSAPIALPDATSVYDVYAEGDIPWSDVIAAANACDPITGCTYSQTGNAVTVTKTNHGLNVNDVREMQVLTGTAVTGHYKVLTSTYNTYTYATPAADTQTTSGNMTIAGLYTINGTVQADQDPRKVLPLLAQSMCGGVVGTTWNMWAGVYQAPVMTLTQDDIVGPLVVSSGATTADLFNGVRGQFVSSENSYVMTDYPSYQNAAYLQADGSEKWYPMDLPFTNQATRAKNLARIVTEAQRNGFSIKATFSLKTWKLSVGKRISFTSALLNQSGKIYTITDKRFGIDQAVELTLKEDDPSIWDTTDAAIVDSTLNTNLANPWVMAAPVINAEPQSGTAHLQVLSDGSILSRIFISWDLCLAAVNFGLIEVQWQTTQADAWQSMTLPGSAISAYISPVEDSEWYTIRIRSVNPTLNVRSGWAYFSYFDPVAAQSGTAYQVVGKTESPPDMTDLFLHGNTLSWTALDKTVTPDLAFYKFRYNRGVNTDWSMAAPSDDTPLLSASSPFTVPALPAGVVTILGKAVDTTGNESVNSVTLFTQLGDLPLANVVETRTFDPTFSGTLVNCTVVAGDLVATALDSFYGTDSNAFYNGGDAASFYEPTSYPAMTYMTDQFRTASVLTGSLATLLISTLGDGVVLEYRAVNPTAFFGTATDPFFGVDADLFFGADAAWQPWPAQILINDDIYQFKVSIAASTTQGNIQTMSLVIDAPDITEIVQGIQLNTAGGVTVVYTKPFTSIKAVQGSLQGVGATGATTLEVTKVSATVISVKALNSAGAEVNSAGLYTDITLQGY